MKRLTPALLFALGPMYPLLEARWRTEPNVETPGTPYGAWLEFAGILCYG